MRSGGGEVARREKRRGQRSDGRRRRPSRPSGGSAEAARQSDGADERKDGTRPREEDTQKKRMVPRLLGRRGKGHLFWDVGEREFAVGLSDFKEFVCLCVWM